jgi:hypothetical protein
MANRCSAARVRVTQRRAALKLRRAVHDDPGSKSQLQNTNPLVKRAAHVNPREPREPRKALKEAQRSLSSQASETVSFNSPMLYRLKA